MPRCIARGRVRRKIRTGSNPFRRCQRTRRPFGHIRSPPPSNTREGHGVEPAPTGCVDTRAGLAFPKQRPVIVLSSEYVRRRPAPFPIGRGIILAAENVWRRIDSTIFRGAASTGECLPDLHDPNAETHVDLPELSSLSRTPSGTPPGAFGFIPRHCGRVGGCRTLSGVSRASPGRSSSVTQIQGLSVSRSTSSRSKYSTNPSGQSSSPLSRPRAPASSHRKIGG